MSAINEAPKEKRMRLGSSISEEEKQTEKLQENRSYLSFEGKIIYKCDFIDCAMICDNLIKLAEASIDFLVVGFDLEWPFSFQTGAGKVAVMQICPNLESCFILQISKLTNLPRAVSVLLAHPKIRLTGVNIKNDIKKLAKDFTILDKEKVIGNCIDSGALANEVFPFTQWWGMEKLVGHLFKMRINKSIKLRMSQWDAFPLSKEQLHYAATDAYASLLLYLELKKKQK